MSQAVIGLLSVVLVYLLMIIWVLIKGRTKNSFDTIFDKSLRKAWEDAGKDVYKYPSPARRPRG